MAKGKNNKSSGKQAPVAKVVQKSNSNNPSANTRTVTPINGATRKQANAAVTASERRNPDKPKDHWSNADFGKRFGSGDIGRLQDKGYNTNQIMKIAQMAFSGGGDNINRINRTNQALYNLGQEAMTPSTYQYRGKDGQSTARSFFPGRTRSRVMGWTGFGSPMTVNTLGTSDQGPSYSQSSVWNLPSSFSGMTTRSTMPGLDQGQGTTSGTTMPTGSEVLPETLPETLPEKLPEKMTEEPFLGDYSDLFSTATGFRSNRSSRRRAGSRAQGFASQTVAPQYSSGVGINYG